MYNRKNHATLLNNSNDDQTMPVRKKRYPLKGLCMAMSLVGAAALVGCQSTPVAYSANTSTLYASQNASQDDSQDVINIEAQRAKAELIETIDAMLHRSYYYESQISISNANRRAALANATPEQLANATSRGMHCEHVHDTSYADVLSEAQEDGYELVDIQEDLEKGVNNKYTAELEQLKEDYINCYTEYSLWEIEETKREMEEYDLWLEEIYDEYDEKDDEDEKEEQDDIDSNNESGDIHETEELGEEGVTLDIEETRHVNENLEDDLEDAASEDVDNENNASDDADKSDEDDENTLPSFMQDYDYNHTELNVINANLLDAYLLQRFNVQSSGVYRAYSGRFTMLPQISYEGRNLALSVNQPIFVDLRRGEIYLWADTLALFVSEYLDDELGTTWANKWLKFSFNDDSLPDGFTKDLLNAHIEAARLMIEQDNDANFSFIELNHPLSDSTQLEQLLSLDSENTLGIDNLSNSSYVVQHAQKTDDIKQSEEIFYRHIYETMTALYPDFIESNGKDEHEDNDDDINAENDDESDDTSDIEVSDQDDTTDVDSDDEENNEEEEFFTAKMFFSGYMYFVKHRANIEKEDDDKNEEVENIDGDSDDISSQQDSDDIENTNNEDILESDAIEDEDEDKNEDDEDDIEEEYQYIDEGIKTLAQYGYDTSGDLVWSRSQYRTEASNHYDDLKDNGEGIVFTSFTTYSPINSQTIAFPNLPENVQTPTSANTINIIEYADDLKERYRDGGGAAFGRMLFSSYFRSYDDYDDYEEAAEASVEEDDSDSHEAEEVTIDDVNNDDHSNEDIEAETGDVDNLDEESEMDDMQIQTDTDIDQSNKEVFLSEYPEMNY